MKEQFRTIKLSGPIKLSYSVDNGKKFWEADQQELLAHITRFVNSYLEQGITLTLRQLYYQLVGEGIIPNAQEVYNRLGDFVSLARYAGKVDWDAMEDRARPQQMSSQWNDVNDLMDSAFASYRLPRWNGQQNYVELLCEKDALTSVLGPIARRWHIRLCVNKGYASSSVVYEMSKRLGKKLKEGKHCIILYVGDHDPSGLDMVRDLRERLEEFLTKGSKYISPELEIRSVALTMPQIKHYKLPPNPAKITDPRAAWYIEQYGKISWEVDALKPEIMQSIVENAVTKTLDLDKYTAMVNQEEADKKMLKKFCSTLKKDKPDKDQEVLEWDQENIKTKVKVMADISERALDPAECKEQGYPKGTVLYTCPLCVNDYESREDCYNHVFDDHDKREFDANYNTEDAD